MARIEISLEEYEALKKDNEKMYSENVKLQKHNEQLNQDNVNLIDAIEEIKESSLIERIFQWRKLYAQFEALINGRQPQKENIVAKEITDVEEKT